MTMFHIPAIILTKPDMNGNTRIILLSSVVSLYQYNLIIKIIEINNSISRYIHKPFLINENVS